jgi:hypothetical protein
MKKTLVFLTLTIALLLCLTGCHSHNYGEWTTTKAPTCEQGGEQERSCSCGEVETRAIMATGHKWTEATCNTPKTCSGCGKTEGVALEHNWTDATCTTPKTCVNCKLTDGEAVGHTFGKWTTTKEPTCIDSGEMKRICITCGHEDKSFINPTPSNHKPVTDPVVPATCTEPGLTEGSHCELCPVIIKAQEPISAKGHTEEPIPAVPATCYSTGLTAGIKCKVCSDILKAQETIKKLEHTPAKAVEENRIEATCTKNGSYDLVVYCSVEKCKYKINSEHKRIPANGHILGAPATCTTAQTCANCPEILYPALGHDWKEATCTEPQICQRTGCGVTDGEAMGHIWSEWVTVKESTETEEGLKERICSDCGDKETGAIPVKAYVRDGDYIYFGEYPQTIKDDSVTITGTTDSRGYYLGSDGYYYAMVAANHYDYESGYAFSTGESIINRNVYYFKVEPIRWRILSEENGEMFILCDSIIANHRFDDDSNNYAESEIRAWLNNTFYNTAFTSLQKAIILTTEVDNSLSSTLSTSNPNICENTNDKIFLLSLAEAYNKAYGFSTASTRKMNTSDFARATGVSMSIFSDYYGISEWWLRSPDSSNDLTRCVSIAGSNFGIFFTDSSRGVVPALRITLEAISPIEPETPVESKKDYIRYGNYIFFGEYPQTIKDDRVTITSTIDSRGYYLGSDGFYYAKVIATPYKSGYTFSTGENVTNGTVYYFKVEPIRWRILSEENGEALILCDSIIANHRFDDKSNNYAESEIRAWLNATFYETAFTALQQAIILTTEVDNSLSSTGSTSNLYVCENTNDKIFLLSVAEIHTSSYGFSKSSGIMLTSDYSRATGAYMCTSSTDLYGYGEWWFRSPYPDRADGGKYIDEDYRWINACSVHFTEKGVVPALRITL